MKLVCGLLLLLRFFLVDSLGEDVPIHLNLSTPTVVNVTRSGRLHILSAPMDPAETSFVVLTVQTPNVPVLVSLRSRPTLDDAANGSDVGLVSLPAVGQETAEWYLASSRETPVAAQLLALPYSNNNTSLVPIPGACNLEFDLENEPNLHLANTSAGNVTRLTFARANVGRRRRDDWPLPCSAGQGSPTFRLTYDLYVRSLGPKMFSKGGLFAEMLKMATTDKIMEHGKLVKTFKGQDITEFYQANYRNRGFIYNVIVTDPVGNNSEAAAYVPAIVYSCQLQPNSLDCEEYNDFGVILVATFTGLAGLVICLFGHRIFSYEIFFLGFVPFFIIFFLTFSSCCMLSPFVISVIAATFGFLGGAVHLALWCRFGKYLPSMLLAGFDLGFLFSAFVFFVTPLENLPAFQPNVNYALAFTCGVLLVPVSFLFFPKVLSVVTCAVWGSYLIFATVSYFTTGILHYVFYNVMRRVTMDTYAQAHHTVHFEVIDYVLFTSWALGALIGGVLQCYLTKDSPTAFPPCPYRAWKENQAACRVEPDQRGSHVQDLSADRFNEESPLLRSRLL